jgi:hypothetical protein
MPLHSRSGRAQLTRTTRPVRTLVIAEIGMRERCCVPIRSGGTHLGYLWVEDGDGHVGGDELPRLAECAEALARSRSTYEDLSAGPTFSSPFGWRPTAWPTSDPSARCLRHLSEEPAEVPHQSRSAAGRPQPSVRTPD